jgi:nucleoside-triphosphatase
VDVEGFEAFLDSIGLDSTGARLVIIDEIGKMECFSQKFKTLINRTLYSEIPLVATIAKKGGGLIEEIKGRGDVEIFEITQENREALVEEISGYERGLVE